MVQAREGKVNIRALFIFAKGNGLILRLTNIRLTYNSHFLNFMLSFFAKIYLGRQGPSVAL